MFEYKLYVHNKILPFFKQEFVPKIDFSFGEPYLKDDFIPHAEK